MGTYPQGFDKAIVAKGNRLMVDDFNRVQGFENIFAIGDAAHQLDKKYPNGLPMLAPVAIQQGKRLAKNLLHLGNGEKPEPFSYFDKGSLATAGRKRAVADLPKNLHMHGFLAWMAWLFVHLFYLIGFRNKMTVLADWIWNYITFDRRVRLIVRPYARKQDRVPQPSAQPPAPAQGIQPATS
jgi:NADH dehydrogenase